MSATPRRFGLLLRGEFSLFRTALPVHLVCLFQPTVLYLLMSAVLVHPTFEMTVLRPAGGEGQALLAAMQEVRSPIGAPYIRPLLVDHVPASRHERDRASYAVMCNVLFEGWPNARQARGG